MAKAMFAPSRRESLLVSSWPLYRTFPADLSEREKTTKAKVSALRLLRFGGHRACSLIPFVLGVMKEAEVRRSDLEALSHGIYGEYADNNRLLRHWHHR